MENFECPICLVSYNDNINKPYVISCGHSLCSQCYDELSQKSSIIQCVICRRSLDANLENPITVFALIPNVNFIQFQNEDAFRSKIENDIEKVTRWSQLALQENENTKQIMSQSIDFAQKQLDQMRQYWIELIDQSSKQISDKSQKIIDQLCNILQNSQDYKYKFPTTVDLIKYKTTTKQSYENHQWIQSPIEVSFNLFSGQEQHIVNQKDQNILEQLKQQIENNHKQLLNGQQNIIQNLQRQMRESNSNSFEEIDDVLEKDYDNNCLTNGAQWLLENRNNRFLPFNLNFQYKLEQAYQRCEEWCKFNTDQFSSSIFNVMQLTRHRYDVNLDRIHPNPCGKIMRQLKY